MHALVVILEKYVLEKIMNACTYLQHTSFSISSKQLISLGVMDHVDIESLSIYAKSYILVKFLTNCDNDEVIIFSLKRAPILQSLSKASFSKFSCKLAFLAISDTTVF